MDPGRPPPSRLLVWGRRASATALAVALLGALLPPLALRGPVLREIVARATRPLCGTIEVEGGHLSWLTVPALLTGRPFALELRGLRVTGPDGGEALFVDRAGGEVEVGRRPWRVVIDHGFAERGRWRLAIDDAGGLGGFLGVFRLAPSDGARAECLAPPAARPGSRTRGASSAENASFAVRPARLEDIDVDLDFPVWGLALSHARAFGSLGLGEPGKPLFTFRVENVRARSGVLRAGPGGAAATIATTTAPFDDVLIARVGVSPEEPADFVLEVGHAKTGRSRLAGKAIFKNVFELRGRRGDRNLPGLELDARWDCLTDAAARVDAPWLPREALGELLDGALEAHVRGPFLALSGAVSLDGERAGFDARVERGERAMLDARATDLALAPFLHEDLQPLLGGRITGRLRATLALGAGFRNADLEIPNADVTLTRDGAGPGPRRVAFRVGAAARVTGPWAERDDTLVLGLEAARLYHRALRLKGLSARWAEIAARGELTLEMPSRPRGAPPDAPEPSARVDADVRVALTSIARWVPPETASARVDAEATLAGPLDHLRARLAFAPSSTATIFGERFRAPRAVTASLDDGRLIALDGLSIARVGGGRLDARGRGQRGGPIEGRLRLTDYPLGALPGLETVFVPAAIGGGHPASLHDALAGALRADVTVSGLAARPTFDGTLALSGVALAGRPLGDGRVRVRAHGFSLDLDGTLGPSIAIWLSATRGRDGVTAAAKLRLHNLALAPWLPPALEGLAVDVTGDARVAVAPHRPFESHAVLHAVGEGSALEIDSTTTGDEARASARGRVELAGLRPLWRDGLAAADGAIDVDVRTEPAVPLSGRLVVARPIALRPRGWPIVFGVAEGSGLEVEGTRLHIPGLTLTAPGARLAVAGDARADLEVPERSTVNLTASGRFDAAELARQARLPGLASASGTIILDARASGEVGDPAAQGTVRLESVELRPSSHAWPAVRVDGVVEAAGHDLTTRGVRVATVGASVAAGVVTVGAPDAPARVTVEGGWPPRVANIDARLVGRGLRLGDARSPFAIGALDLDLRLSGDPARELVLAGDVDVARARLDPFAGKTKASGTARPWFEGLPPRLRLDLTLRGPADALEVKVPVLPDVAVGFQCRVSGSARGGTISGRVSGSGAYSRAMLALFGPKGARECRVLKE